MPAHAVELVQRRGTFTIMTDTVVPPERFADFLKCYGPAAAAEIRRCKAAFDPSFLLDRGNVVEPDDGPTRTGR
ncbi:MAG: hypothetical protein R6X19_00375, partial [Kiritimatiellia bacterium]